MELTRDTLAAATVDDIVAWAAEQPWRQAMSECRQDARWHSEGDVWTHTRMVCAQLSRLAEWQELSRRDQAVLALTAIFHDAGKPLTTQVDPETGRISSPKHAVEGERLARAALRELGCELTLREEIVRMVRYHGRPAFLLERPQPEREVIGLSWAVNNRLLYLFALADTRGRSAAEFARPEENLHLWKAVAEDAGCFERPYPFANDQARCLFFRQAESDLHYVPHEDYRCTVTILSGLPGCGKDTWLAKHRPGVPIVSLDAVRDELGVDATENQGAVAQRARERCRELLRGRTSFAFNATNLLRRTRRRWIDLFSDYRARVEIVYLEPPLATVMKQNRRRSRPVPDDVIGSLAERCEPPDWTEAHGLSLLEGAAAP